MPASPNQPLPTDSLANDIVKLYFSINVATYQLLKLIAQFDALNTAATEGFLTTAHWLSYYLGIGPNAAREKVRVARALEDLPLIDEAFAQGRLSYSKVRALTRVTTSKNEQTLLRMAKNASAQQLERIVRDQVKVQRGRAEHSATPELDLTRAANGSWCIRGTLPKELGELLRQALRQITDTMTTSDPQQDDAPSPPEQRALALIEMAESTLTTADRTSSSADRYLVHIDADDPDLSAAARERLLCDGSVVVHQSDAAGEPLNVGRKTRTIPPAIRRALQRRDKGCRFPGCTHTRFVDAHHVHHWAHGGETKLNNLLLLCRRHHTLVHEGVVRIQADQPPVGAVRFQFKNQQGQPLLSTGDGCLANAQVQQLPIQMRADVTAVTSAERSPLAPCNPTKRPDYREIAWVLGQFEDN